MPRSADESVGFDRPYPPGWFDRLIDWIDRMPGPNSLYCIGLLALQLGYMSCMLWLVGKLPVGSFDLRLVFVVVVTPYLLFVRLSLDRLAAATLDAFRPVLAVTEGEFRRLHYELKTLPARTTRVVTSVTIAIAFLNAMLTRDSIVQEFASSRAAALMIIAPVGFCTFAVAALSVVQVIQQLRTVDRIHALVGKIELLRSKPLHAFSKLAAWTGVSLLLLTYYVASIRPDLVSSSRALEALLIAMIPTAVACFVLPLRGMHRRLAAEKDRALGEVASRYEAVFARLHERVDQDLLADADKLNAQIASLSAERTALERVSTWPWEPAALTGFLTTLVLPVLLWGIQKALEWALDS